MIIDCFTHFWDSETLPKDRLGDGFFGPPFTTDSRQRPELPPAGEDGHWSAAEPVDRAFIVGFTSHYLGISVPNERISKYVKQHPDKLVGFAGIDPSDSKSAQDEIDRAHQELGMRGVSLAPSAQNFHPSNSQAMLVYQRAADLGMPMIFHTGIHTSPSCRLEYARPLLLDEVAREIPKLKIVVSHLGYPWVGETLLLLAKHGNVYADISWIMLEPWQAYQSLLAASQHGVMHKLLFASGFPFAHAARTIEQLFDVNHLAQGTNLPKIPRKELRGIVERNALALLNLEDGREGQGSDRASSALTGEGDFDDHSGVAG